ncbi:MAG: hypothetical protein COB04_02420 [Gammaproteobacteria bacterium]|nr:MAG: hypothetical protein COB04_02420 [Gammaproteobacteria bacterium]
MSADKSFLGKGWGFPPTFHRVGKGIAVAMVEEDEDIKQSLNILFSTRKGERLFHNYGSDLRAMVFDDLTESTITDLKNAIERAVLFHEMRIELLSTEINLDTIKDGRIVITLDYRVRTTNNRHNMVYPFYITEGTNLKSS